MSTAYLLLALATILVNTAAAIADFAGAKFVRANSSELNLPTSWILPLGLLKAAGAAGLVLGLLGFRPLGLAAAIGLTLFFLGASLVHLRARVFHNIAAPLAFLALAVATLVLDLAR
ncbi:MULTISPECIES: DoxX family protein [unclassified Crossiella]|uniref:DoxX family protein n=1 Tax=unclassified Crossiella TaxID=2620835 RepID=UPI001FFF9FDF|nr:MULTISPECIES: DoxX family protein [unclassified Crossiella]MCK2242968.1 DoxX family protein [Crossiella sp. S99.2]MCK2256845.1 DoxX family protein [Crossiella sp. S99.1]